MKHMSQQERQEAVNEIRLMASIQHPNVVAYHEAFIDGNKLCIVMEFAPYGDLARAIRKGQAMRKPFPEDMIWSFFIQARTRRVCLRHTCAARAHRVVASQAPGLCDAVRSCDVPPGITSLAPRCARRWRPCTTPASSTATSRRLTY